MFLFEINVTEHLTDGTDRVLSTRSWASPTGNSREPERFIRQSYRELTGENIDVQISSSNWRLDSPDGRYSWTAAWKPYI